jgi:hypothetical protein
MDKYLSSKGITFPTVANCDACHAVSRGNNIAIVVRNTCVNCARRDVLLFYSILSVLRKEEEEEEKKIAMALKATPPVMMEKKIKVIADDILQSVSSFDNSFFEEIKGIPRAQLHLAGAGTDDEIFKALKITLASLSADGDESAKVMLQCANSAGYFINDQVKPVRIIKKEFLKLLPEGTLDLCIARSLCCPGINQFQSVFGDQVCRVHRVSDKGIVEPFVNADILCPGNLGPASGGFVIQLPVTRPMADPRVEAFLQKKGPSRPSLLGSLDRILKTRLSELGIPANLVSKIPKRVIEGLSKLEHYKAAATIAVMKKADFALPNANQQKGKGKGKAKKPTPKKSAPTPKRTQSKGRGNNNRPKTYAAVVQPSPPSFDPIMLMAMSQGSNNNLMPYLMMQQQMQQQAKVNIPPPTQNKRVRGNDKQKKKNLPQKSNNTKLITVLKGLYGDHRFNLQFARTHYKNGVIEIPHDYDEDFFKSQLILDKGTAIKKKDKTEKVSFSLPSSPRSEVFHAVS